MPSPTAVEIARDLIRFNTVNPPGDEAQAVSYVGAILEGAGFSVKKYCFAEHRTSLVAEALTDDDRPPLCFTGHLDTVGLGSVAWSFDPFAGHTCGGMLYGRGSSDMKGGIGAIVAAALQTSATRRSNLKLVLTAGEETGCEGAHHLSLLGVLGSARAIVVAEPTANVPCFGHRGVLWLSLQIAGRAAHGSTPHLGNNAVVKAASAIQGLDRFNFEIGTHRYLGSPSLNVGYCHGGGNINVVPDRAQIGIDIRTTPGLDPEQLMSKLARLAPEGGLTKLLDLPPVFTNPDDEWFQLVIDLANSISSAGAAPRAAPFFTDASILAAAFNSPPTAIVGPGETSMAHCVDECCAIREIEEATEIYMKLMQT
jgi:succinyl-diaminopimelate desuccinylase